MQGEVTLHGWIHSCLSGWKEAQLTCKTTRREVCPRWLIPGSLIDQSKIRRGVYCDMLTAPSRSRLHCCRFFQSA